MTGMLSLVCGIFPAEIVVERVWIFSCEGAERNHCLLTKTRLLEF